jgi:flagellar protein FlbD
MKNHWTVALILLRRLGGPVFGLNPDLIERAESTPDTVLTMVGGNKYVVCESLTEVTDLVREHRARVIAAAESMSLSSDGYDRHAPSVTTHANAARLHDVSQSSSAAQSSVVPLRPKDI